MLDLFTNKYPYTDYHELNLDWIISQLVKFNSELANFVSLNTIKYANPIAWDITKQYETNTIVIDSRTGTAYISSKPVPSGVSIENTDYWSVVFDLSPLMVEYYGLREQISINFEENYTSTHDYEPGDWIFIHDEGEGKDLLYIATSTINVFGGLVPDFNITKVTIEDLIGNQTDLTTTHKSTIVGAVNEVNANVGDLADLTTTDNDSAVNAINEVNANVGDLTDLNTTDKSSAVNAINEVLSDLDTTVGDLADLTTTDKDSVVDAINEVNANVGDLTDLNTTDKSSAVNAINELLTDISEVELHHTYINIMSFGAHADGVTDDSQALQDAIDSAGHNGVVYIPQGLYLLSSKINLENITLMGCKILDGDAPFENGSTFVIKQTSTEVFELGNNVTLEGIGFYYPDQDGTNVSPIVYPPTITYTASINVIIRGCVFYNSYIGIAPSATPDTIGRIILDSIYAYCVKTFFHLHQSKDTITLTNSFITSGIFQDIAWRGDEYLAKYTVNNGEAIVISNDCDDFKISNCIIYGYYKAILMESTAEVNMLKVNNVHFDACNCALYATSGSTLDNTLINGCNFFTYSSVFTGTDIPTIYLACTSTTTILISDCVAEIHHWFVECATKVNDLKLDTVDMHGLPSNITANIIRATIFTCTNVKFRSAGGSSGNRTLATVDTPYIIIDAVFMENGQVGIDVTNCTTLVVANSLSVGQSNPIGTTNVGTLLKSNCNF